MPYTNTIVEFINGYLKAGTLNKETFQPGKFFNIASPVLKEQDKIMVSYPGVIDTDGEIEMVTPDDTYNIQVYHKAISNAYSTTQVGSYGDSMMTNSLSEMQMIVFAQSDKIRMTAEQLETHFIFGIPTGITQALSDEIKMKVGITVLSSDMDKLRNFRNEFQNIKYFLKPEHIFFSIRYQIKTKFDRECVDACLCE